MNGRWYIASTLLYLQALPYKLVKSIATTGSFPTTPALCPGRITPVSPGPNEFFFRIIIPNYLQSSGNKILCMRCLTAIAIKWIVLLKRRLTPKIFYNIPSIGTILSMVLLLGTILTAHVVIIQAIGIYSIGRIQFIWQNPDSKKWDMFLYGQKYTNSVIVFLETL